ncbi:MAG: glycosyltransferase family 2 protein [Chloroflexaceae bacterium]|jgi:hypothetical protein|nr:glycosyltransferase family 2 protein [Chloroflexaceae bacterium]
MQPRVAILILCYNGMADTLACLESLRHVEYPQARYEVVVLDNASSDATVEQVRSQFPEVTVIENGANLGFAAGNNVGLRYALAQGFDYALLLNNDTEVVPDLLQRMVEVAEADSTIGVVGPTITYYERPDLIWSAGGSIDWQHGTCVMPEHGQPDLGRRGDPRAVDFVTGCALLVKRAALKQAGLLDERFFMYFEETEWCVRIARAGFRILQVPTALVRHKIPLNARYDKEYLAYYMTRNRLLFLWATHARWSTRCMAMSQDIRTYLSICLRPKWRNRPGRVGMREAWFDFWRGRFGQWRQQLPG